MGCTGDVHIAAVWMMGNSGCITVYYIESCGCYDDYETEFRSLMAWGKKLLRSLSVLANMLL